jgi:hypothetical protein
MTDAKILSAATGRAVEGDLDRWVASGARLLTTARARLQRALHDNETGRAKIIADAQQALAELRTRTHEELRRFDREQGELIADLNEEVSRLEQMRDAGDWPVQH